MVSPLKLKRESVGKVSIAPTNPYLQVLVDTGVFHLDQPYEYVLPEKLKVEVGDWVSVPFNSRNCLGLVIERYSKSRNIAAKSKSLPVNKKVKGARIAARQLEFYRAVAARWSVPIFDVLRFVSKEGNAENPENSISKKHSYVAERTYVQFRPDLDETNQLILKLKEIAKTGSTLVIVPEARLATRLASPEYQIGSRGSVLTAQSFKNLVVVREESGHHFELKSPDRKSTRLNSSHSSVSRMPSSA